jgi:predicted nucleic acid-binding protein
MHDTPDVYPEWRRLVTLYNVKGIQVHDARLVAGMKVHGIGSILTYNPTDFKRYPGITVVHPRDVRGR